NLVIRSLYSNKEIFLRELISNASDAAEKLRFEALTDEALFEEDPELKVRVTYDKEAGTLTISDNGIGMSRQDVTETIGTIASSGTRKFFEAMSGDQAKDSELIGQFGVGFYSAFIVADKVTLKTRRAGLGHEHGVQWVSEGQGSYSIENVDKPSRGTDVILHLREDEKEFLEGFRLRNIISKFSDHITMPVEMEKEFYGEDEEKPESAEFERVNTGTALWMRSRSEISDEEYNEFYKHVSHDFEDPLLHVHNRVEGNNEYTALLFVPARAPFDLWDRDQKHGVKLFVRRVFIMDEAEKLMPRYMRFVKGVVDSDDLPLNVSREILQHNRKIDTIRQANVKRVLGALEKLAENDKEKYQEFWDQFGKVLKEGPAEDFANKEKISALLRFASTHNEQDEQTVSLADYVSRMREGQDKIYYITADSAAAARFSPHLEVLKKKGIEVLLLSDRVDEWLVTSLTEFDGKTLQSVAKGELDLGELEDKEEQESQEKQSEEHKALLERMQQVLQESVKEIRVSQRLTDSPACLVVEEHDMSANLARVLKSVGQDAPQTKPIMEVNATHPLVVQLENESDEERFGDLSKVLFDQAQLAEGGQLDDPAAFVRRLNSLMLKLAGH
ncbi:MAG: molecular chaperone HtpG, partial [Candidatus Thiodiazotropha endolucinida]|nr:molecular chaperone HtpG [Candidatus Thiodiazotropha taylori]MCW4322409.1 molecular chaperone HtpG [Candidatus Thiodiazotropha taylori]